MSIRPVVLVVFAVTVALCLPTSLAAQSGWKLHVDGVWLDPDGEISYVDFEGDTITTTADSSTGFGAGIEYRFSNRLGLELGVVTGVDIDFNVNVASGPLSVDLKDSMGFTLTSLGLNIYFTSGDGVQFYLTPVVGTASYDNLTFTIFDETIRIDVDGDTVYGGTVGLDLPLGGSAWFVTGRLSYLVASVDVRDKDEPQDPGTEIDIDPLIATVGIGIRF
jgi:outer membrane protein W